MSFEKQPTVVFVLGGPGAGKGTQCAKIVEVGGCASAREQDTDRLALVSVVAVAAPAASGVAVTIPFRLLLLPLLGVVVDFSRGVP